MPMEVQAQLDTLPEYSVLISVYNRDIPAWFEEAVESMAGQSLRPREIVIVEDGCLTEALYAAEQRCVDRYPELIRTVTLEKNQAACKNVSANGLREWMRMIFQSRTAAKRS